ncbi:hypothetical protein KP509_12G010700 [Ceratopteris richardii]|uniref:Uncharacterized protein n=1 Tax=Ceratopteris richardii TaxID=49495 RepID=A0A8T2TL78_CERRI|nr:hypothetical protein KP509_12G010700 [Ceratopteris richardii]
MVQYHWTPFEYFQVNSRSKSVFLWQFMKLTILQIPITHCQALTVQPALSISCSYECSTLKVHVRFFFCAYRGFHINKLFRLPMETADDCPDLWYKKGALWMYCVLSVAFYSFQEH